MLKMTTMSLSSRRTGATQATTGLTSWLPTPRKAWGTQLGTESVLTRFAALSMLELNLSSCLFFQCGLIINISTLGGLLAPSIANLPQGVRWPDIALLPHRKLVP